MQRCNGGESCDLYLFSSIPKTNPNTATPPPPSTASIKERKRQTRLRSSYCRRPDRESLAADRESAPAAARGSAAAAAAAGEDITHGC